MSEMVDRLARVIGAAYDGEADPETTPNNWRRAVSAARDVIAAMREPSEEMKAAEDIHWGYNCQICGGLTDGWRKMIDAALTPPEIAS